MNKEYKTETVVYPVVITYEDGVYYTSIVDFDKNEDGSIDYYVSFAEKIDEIGVTIRDRLSLKLADLLDMRKEFPKATKQEEIVLKENQYINYISIDPIYEVSKVTNQLKRKTLNIPIWLDIVATEKKLNFSQLLQKELKKELGIE